MIALTLHVDELAVIDSVIAVACEQYNFREDFFVDEAEDDEAEDEKTVYQDGFGAIRQATAQDTAAFALICALCELRKLVLQRMAEQLTKAVGTTTPTVPR